MTMLGQHLGSEQAAEAMRGVIAHRQRETAQQWMRDGIERDRRERPELTDLAELIVPLIERALDARARQREQEQKVAKAADLIRRIRAAGVTLSFLDGKLCGGPNGKVRPWMRTAVKELKTYVIAQLLAERKL